VADTDQGAVEQARELIAAARSVTVLTGAGVSTDSGIPDFRGPQGVWTKNPAAERIWTFEHYRGDAEVGRAAWQDRVEHPMWTATPGPAHDALVGLERSGKLVALLTQNIDELHQMAGNSPDKVIEVHGTVRKVVCMACGMTVRGKANHAAIAEKISLRFAVKTLVLGGKVRLETTNATVFVTKVVEAFLGDIKGFSVSKPSLEDVFIRATASEKAA